MLPLVTIYQQNYTQTAMILDDLYSQENALSADLDQLIRLVKDQEEDFLHINAIITKILYCRAEIENRIYIHDEIIQYKHLIEQQQLKLQDYNRRNQHLYQHTPSSLTLTDRTNILLKRATHRTLQNISYTINQSSHKNGPLSSKFNQLKIMCQKILTDTPHGKSLHLISTIGQFSQRKLEILLRVFKNITFNLENGQVQELQKFKSCSFENLNKQIFRQEKPRKQAKNIGHIRVEIYPKPSAQKAPSAKDQCKDNDPNRFHLFKKAKKVMDNLKDVMEFSRQDFIEAFIEVCSESKDKALKYLRTRNEANQRQINSFLSKNPRKRCRKMSSQPFVGQNKLKTSQEIDKNGSQKNEANQSTCYTARKSLLLKFKQNDYRQKTTTTDFFRKLSRVEAYRQKAKFLRKKSSGEIEPKDKQKKNSIIKAIENIICENEELDLKGDLPGQQRLPPLNKRAMSVDQNYRTEEAKEAELNASKIVISSMMQVQPVGKSSRWQRRQACSGNAKIESKILRTLIQHQVNSKLINLNNINKQVWF